MKPYSLKICDICLRSEIYPLIDNPQGKLLAIKREHTDLDALMLCGECRDAEKLRIKKQGA